MQKPRLVKVFPSVVTTLASLCLHEQHADLLINVFEHPKSIRAVHLSPSMSSLIMGSISYVHLPGKETSTQPSSICCLTCYGNPAKNAQAIHFSNGLSLTWRASFLSAAKNSLTISPLQSRHVTNFSNATNASTANAVVRARLISLISALC